MLGGPRQFPWRSVPWYYVQYDAWVSWEEPIQPANPQTSDQVDDPVRRSGTCQHGRATFEAWMRPHCCTLFQAVQTTCTAALLLHVRVMSRVVS